MQQNFQKELDGILAELSGSRPRLLLHSCCGPCSSYVLEYLTQHFDVSVLFYNPNIQPEAEYEKRLHWQKQLLSDMPFSSPVTLLPESWRGADFEEAARGLETEPEGGARCTACFALRLEETARRAAAEGIPWFGTTLTVSPHKDAQRINRLGVELAERYGLHWLPSDFKKREGYKRSIQLSAQYGLYRQDYCGCGFSAR